MNPLVIKLILAAVLVGGIAGMGWRVNEWRQAYHELPRLEQKLELEEKCGEGSECEARKVAAQKRADKASEELRTQHEKDLVKIASRPPRIVRVCDSSMSSPSGVDDGGTSGEPDVLSGSVGQDIGPDLYALAREADKQLALRRALVRWNREVAKE